MRKFLVAVAVLFGFGLGSASAAQGDGLGAYMSGGPSDPFCQFFGTTCTVGGSFLSASGWPAFEALAPEDGGGTLAGWAAWEKAMPGRRIVTVGIPMYAWKVGGSFAACAAGSYNSHYTALAQNIMGSGLEHIDLRLAWEFDGSWQGTDGIYPAGDFTNFVGCWKQIVNTMRAVDDKGVITYDWNPTSGCCNYLDENYWPGDQYVSYVGMDHYANTGNRTQTLVEITAFAKKHGKKVTFPEWGLWNGEDTAYIQQMHDYMADPANNVAFGDYFNDAGDAHHSLTDGSYPNSSALFKTLFANYATPVGMFLTGVTPPPPPPPPPPTAGVYDHVVVAVLENHAYSDVLAAMNGGQMPWTQSLATSGARMDGDNAVAHPSEPNYLMLFAGSTFGITDDNNHSLSGPNWLSEAQAVGKTFVQWYGGTLHTDQWEQHLPEFMFDGKVGTPISCSPSPCAQFPTDFTKLPAISLFVPGYNDDAHDGTLTQADSYLQSHLAAYATWAATHNSALIVTFDESLGTDTAGGGGHVMTVIAGSGVKAGHYSEAINTATLHRTVLAMVGVPPAASDPSGAVAPITDVFGGVSPPPPPPPAPGSDLGVFMLAEDVCKDSTNNQDAQAQVLVDGVALGAPISVTAVQPGGQQEADVSFAQVAAGTHKIGVKYLNNYHPATCDRNLWVHSFTLNGVSYVASGDSTSVGGAYDQPTMDANGWGPAGQYPLYVTGDTWNADAVPITHPSKVETLAINAQPFHGVTIPLTGSITNLSAAPTGLDLVVNNGTPAPATCSVLTASSFTCAWTPAAPGSYTVQLKDHASGVASSAVTLVVN